MSGQIKTKWILNNAVNGDKIRLANDQYLRARNSTDSGDVNLLKATSTNKAEFGVEPLYNGTPTLSTSLINRQYLEDFVAGIRDPKDAVDYATNAALPACTPAGSKVGHTLTGDVNGALSVDGSAVLANQRILVKDQAAGDDNGIYKVTQVGDGGNPFILTRATDADSDAEVTHGLSCDVISGSANGRTRWLLSTVDPIDLDVTSLTFVEIPAPVTQVQFKEEQFTLISGDISNGYVDLQNEAITESILVWPDGGIPQKRTTDYTTSVVSLVTRITFAGDLSANLAAGDILIVKYAHN